MPKRCSTISRSSRTFGWAAGLLLAAHPAHGAPPVRDGYWISAEVVSVTGGDDGLGDALALLEVGPAHDRPEGPGERPPGTVVGRVDSIERAFEYLETHVFSQAVGFGDDRAEIRSPDAPAPGTRLYKEHGVVLRAFHVTGRTGDGGMRTIDWPRRSEQVLPPHLRWRPAQLWQTTPIFAAPAATLPPADERHADLPSGTIAYVLGELDRCAPSTGCLRWAQVVAREDNRFVAGYVPAFEVVYDARPNPEISIQPFALGEGVAHFAIVFPERRSSQSLRVPSGSETRFPSLTVEPLGADSDSDSDSDASWAVRHDGAVVLEF